MKEIVELELTCEQGLFRTRVGTIVVSSVDRQHQDSVLALTLDRLLLDPLLGRSSDQRYETMAFRCDETGRVSNFIELAMNRCNSLSQVRAMHDQMVARFTVTDDERKNDEGRSGAND